MRHTAKLEMGDSGISEQSRDVSARKTPSTSRVPTINEIEEDGKIDMGNFYKLFNINNRQRFSHLFKHARLESPFAIEIIRITLRWGPISVMRKAVS